MDISIIIPVYNVERYIERCVKSVINQAYKGEVECIIVNDCTPDNSINIIKEVLLVYHGNIQFKILHHTKNKGLAHARNTGLKTAVGDYVIQVDGDDYFESDMLCKMYAKAKLENADIVIADFYLTFPTRDEYQKQILPSSKKEIVQRLVWCPFRNDFTRGVWNKLIRRSLYIDNNIFCYPNINYGEDLLAMLHIFDVAVKIVNVQEAFYHYVQYNANSYCSTITLGNIENRIQGNEIISEFVTKRQIDCKKELAFKKLSDKSYILFGTSGKMQQQYVTLYTEAEEYISNFVDECINSSYWKFAYKLGLRGNLLLFNLMRNFWMMVRNKKVTLLK